MLQLPEGVGAETGNILEGLRVPLVRVLIAIKLFELDTSVREAAHQLGLSYNTVYDLFDLFRQSIARTDSDSTFTLSGEIEMDESYFGGRRKGNWGRGAAGKIPVFGILNGEKRFGLKLFRMSPVKLSSLWR